LVDFYFWVVLLSLFRYIDELVVVMADKINLTATAYKRVKKDSKVFMSLSFFNKYLLIGM